ncbi:tetraspanin-1 isoform X1 [Brachionus plicatilis]|uniref:Tetraspanin n=1 Tax=Brachionus plicatilis TaxID=10195 RepID=A0A3M7PEF6_BRAPC|nr:tetraspanin-1 isoform X1 [Brachionus plicatilis]
MLSSRATLVILNTFFFLFGCCTLAIGLWSQYDKEFSSLWDSLDIGKIIDSRNLNAARLLLIISGIMSVFVSFIGLYGSLAKDRCFLSAYCLLMGIILILEIAAAAVLMSYRSDAKEKLRDGLNRTVEAINKNEDKVALNVMNTVQTFFKCCGANGPNDYLDLTNMTSCQVPDSKQDHPIFYQNGCYNAIISFIDTHLPLLLGFTIILISFQIFCLLVSIKGCAQIRYDGYEDI